MKANSDKSKQSKKATRRVLAGVLCGASVLSLVLSLVMPPISQAIANDAQTVSTEETVTGDSSSESTGVDNTNNGDTENQNSDDAENGASEDAAAAGLPSDDTKVEGDTQPSDAQPADDDNNDENAIAPVSADGYTEVSDDVAGKFTNGGKFRLTDYAYSDKQITINKDTTIDLNGNMLCNRSGGLDSFFVVENKATLTIEDLGQTTIDASSSVDTANTPAGQLASMEWEKGSSSNNGTPKSLTYYETKSTPKTDGLGTTETTYRHVVTGFGAIDAASDRGSVKYVVNVEAGCTLDLKGGMITTAANLSPDGHVIYSEGTVKIAGGYVTNGNGGGWGGGLCIAGTNPKLEMTGGVVAGNKAAAGGGVFANFGATLNLAGGIISGNATYGNPINNGDDTGDGGYGGGVYTKGANVTISGSACITNNRADDRITDSNLFNNGLLGGGGIACTHGGKLSITSGFVTANYSREAGGGVYAGFYSKNNGKNISFEMTGGTIAGNESDNAEGGGLRVAGGEGGDNVGTNATICAGENSKIYITNNKTMTGQNRGGDWGGGGVFVQKGGKLNIVRTLITDNEAGGWGGGIGACPTGETIVSHSNGAAIYNNTDHDGEHVSAGGHDKDQDKNSDYITPTFKEAGHKDFFLVRKNDSQNTVAVVLGKMLGGDSAGWQGTCDGEKITIDPNGGAEAKYMFGLEAHPTADAMGKAQTAATTIISGNYSYTHGGGIMTNGDLVVGDVTGLDVYPNMELHATKVLMGANGQPTSLKGHNYKFKLLRQVGDKAPTWKDDRTFDMGDCSVAGEATVKPDGSITFDSGKDYSSGQYVFYLVEEPVSGENEMGARFDETIYKMVVTVDSSSYKTEYLMSIPIKYYKVTGVIVYKKGEKDSGFQELNSGSYSVDYSNDCTTATVNLGNSSNNPAFTNKIVPYTSTGSWTPKATKVVKGGEMKEFTLEFADNEDFNNAKTVNTKAGDKKSQTLSFVDKIEYTLDKLNKLESDSTGRGASNTFTYYVREQPPTAPFTNYKYDMSVYKITVNATDQSDRTIKCDVTYTKIVDAKGKEIPANKQDPCKYGEDANTGQSLPTFTNTYLTSLPLSGMSGVTLTYLAGAAVLCAAAAWMHIRRKANAKGGERRE